MVNKFKLTMHHCLIDFACPNPMQTCACAFDLKTRRIKVLCEQTREANKRIKMFFGLCLLLFGFGNIVADFHVLFRLRGN